MHSIIALQCWVRVQIILHSLCYSYRLLITVYCILFLFRMVGKAGRSGRRPAATASPAAAPHRSSTSELSLIVQAQVGVRRSIYFFLHPLTPTTPNTLQLIVSWTLKGLTLGLDVWRANSLATLLDCYQHAGCRPRGGGIAVERTLGPPQCPQFPGAMPPLPLTSQRRSGAGGHPHNPVW